MSMSLHDREGGLMESIENLREWETSVLVEDGGVTTIGKMCDEIEAEIERNFVRLPWGWEAEQAASVLSYWPTWDDGSPCMFGDEFTCYPKYDSKNEYEVFDRLVIYGPNHVWSRGCDDETPHEGGYYEWNFMRPGGDGCEVYRPTKRKPRTLTDVLRDLFERKMTVTDAEQELRELIEVDV